MLAKGLKQLLITTVAVSAISISPVVSFAQVQKNIQPPSEHKTNSTPQASIVPQGPNIDAGAYALLDVDSGKLLAAKNPHKRMQPASLTKMMTLYLIFDSLKNGQISLDDKVLISEKAWKMGGSKMFVKVGNRVPVHDLIKGIIVASGNDASVAMAEYIGGTEGTFVQMMNQAAKNLGMNDTHFADPTGLPKPDHYSSAADLATLARTIISEFPEQYHWFSEKWITHNGIRQPNRNRLLWHDPSVDGLKTGHTSQAGFCLTASAQRNGMRILSVVLKTPSDNGRMQSTEALLNYGFRFYQTHLMYNANQSIDKPRIWFGQKKNISVGLSEPFYLTLPQGEYKKVKIVEDLHKTIEAPIKAGDNVGVLNVKLDEKIIASRPLIALEEDEKGSAWSRAWDYVTLLFHKIIA